MNFVLNSNWPAYNNRLYASWAFSNGLSALEFQINFSILALANRVSSGKASSGNYPSPPCVKPRPLAVIVKDTSQKLTMELNPKTYEPNIELTEFVKRYWTLDGEKENIPLKNTIVPDGTMKLIFHYGDTYKNHSQNGEITILPKCFLIGQLTKPYVIEPTGVTGSFVVQFKPNGFLPFTSIQIKEMENKAIPLDKLFGENGKKLGEQILNAISTTERIEIIETFLIKQLAKKKTIDNIVNSTVETIFNRNGQFSVNEFSENNNINRRQLARKFSSAIGLSPKQLAKTIRIQTTLTVLLNEEITSLTDLAYENEYFDQAHFIKEFKEFTGLTPKEFFGESLKMSLIFDKK